MRRTLVGALVVVLGFGAACTPNQTSSSPPLNATWTGSLIQDRTVGLDGSEWGSVAHNDGWIARARTGATPGGVTAEETTLTPRTGVGLAGLGVPQVLSPTRYQFMTGFTGAPLVDQPYLGDQLLLAGGATPTGPNQLFLEVAGTWQLAGTFTLGWAERVLAVNDSQIVTRENLTGAPLHVYPVTTSGTTVTVGAPVDVALPATWDVADLRGAAFDGSTLVVVSDVGGTTVATVGLTDPTTATLTEVYHTTGYAPRQASIDRDGTTLRVAIGALNATGTPKGKVLVVSKPDAGSWSRTATLSAPSGLTDITNGAYMGTRVAIDDGLLVTITRLVNLPSGSSSGTSTLSVLGAYERNGSGWRHVASMNAAPSAPITSAETGRLARDIDVAGRVISDEVMGSEEGAVPGSFFAESWRFEAP